MPQIKSAMKRVKTNEKARLRNKGQMSELRTTLKEFRNAAADNSADKDALFLKANRAVDMAKSKGLIKANKASRDKSRLSKLMK